MEASYWDFLIIPLHFSLHFFGLQGRIGFDAHAQGADIQDLADFVDGGLFSGKNRFRSKRTS
jgi:hypothetical protein